MTDGRESIQGFVATFLIGAVAGVSPFVFIQLLPVLLNPGVDLAQPNYVAILMSGILIGVITAIVFSSSFQQKGARDIFFNALGIPAILIATISTIGTEFSAYSKVSEAKDSASAAILSPPEEGVIRGILEPVKRPTVDNKGTFSKGVAWAGQKAYSSDMLVAQANEYLLVLGEYEDSGQAWKEYDRLNSETLRTERYAPKDLQVLKVEGNRFLLIYKTCPTLQEAEKVYKLIRINNPELKVNIIKNVQ